ncbi:MAG: hypothetical protein IT433_04020 [Phycisphaerales bacterium]|nr:hypothetical protein [Phycisphaerales bacterium]
MELDRVFVEPDMNSRTLRSLFGKFGLGRASGSRIDALLRHVGRAMGAEGERPFDGAMTLEDRKLLEGSFGTAIVVTLDGQGNGSSAGAINPAVNSTDNDYYQFTATGNDFVRILADTVNETPTSSLNTRVTVYGSADLADIVAQGSNNGSLTSGVQRDGWAGFIAETGHTYFVVVSSDFTGTPPSQPTNNTYTLQIGAQSKTFDLWTETGIGIEAGSPPPAPPAVPPTPIVDALIRRQEDVVYRFIAPNDPSQNSLVTVNVQFTNYNPAPLPASTIPDRMDTRVEIYNAAGVLISSDSDAGRINDAFAAFKATPGATYYLRVRSDEVRPRNAANPAFDVSLATGPFYIVLDTASENIELNPVRRLGSVPGGAFEGFGAPTTPPTPNIAAPTFQTHLYDFTAQGDGLAFITVQPTGLAPVTDPAVRVYDASGNLIGFNDNYSGASAELQIRLVGGQKYFVVVDGFEINSQVQYTVNIEAQHTFTPSNGTTTVDDHVNTPTIPQTPTPADLENIRRQFNLATGLTWTDPFATFDADQNVVRDRGLRVGAQGTGRLWTAGDTDLFQIVPQVDMLIDYSGNNDDNGTSLFIGGIFDTADPGTAWPVGSRNLTLWDAADYWFTGAQYFDAQENVTYGFNDNADTAGTAGPEIYVLQDWDTDPTAQPANGFTDRVLVVGGDFDLIIPTPFGPQIIKNLAVWVQNTQTGRFEWATLGDANGPVRAAAIYDPVPWDIDPQSTLPEDVLDEGLVLGGDFTDIGGAALQRLAYINLETGILPIGAGIDNGSVRALSVFDPDYSLTERQATAGPPPLDEVLAVRDTEPSLFIGGDFDLNGNDENFAVSVGLLGDPTPPGEIFVSPSRPVVDTSVAGVINAFTTATFTIEDPENPGEFIDAPMLVAGGSFTSAGGVARENIAKFGLLQGDLDDQSPTYNPFVSWDDITDNDTGIPNAEVFALTVWDPADINNTTIDPVLVVGGSWTGFNGFDNLIGLDTFEGEDGGFGAWGWFSQGAGPQGAVRALTVVNDEQEPGIATNLRTGAPQQVLYAGGDFTLIDDGSPAGLRANHVAQYSAFRGQVADFFAYSRMTNGVENTAANPPANATVFALSPFDDGNPLEWDRHDRRQTRMEITVAGSDGSFINAFVRVYDSTFKLIYSNETKSPPFPDPAGSIDYSLAGGGAQPTFEMPPIWGGETYYIEISGTGTGRYTLTVIADALPVDINGDGVLDDVNAVMVEEPDENQFVRALAVGSTLGTGDGTNFVAANTEPLHGNAQRVQKINPSTNLQFQTTTDLGNIETIDDTDLYLFRAEFTGNVEIRVSTSLLIDAYGEQYGTDFRGLVTDGQQVGTKTSLLDAAIRVFRNDFEQIAYADDNPAIAGELADIQFANLVDGNGDPVINRFFGRDPRVVIPVVAGNTYYIQVESGMMFQDGSAALIEDRVPNVAREIDIRRATGGYQILLNAMPQLANDVENGQTVQDDHIDTNPNAAAFNLATPIIMGDLRSGQNGVGSISGVINNTPFQPVDVDSFTFISPGSGELQIRLTRPTGSVLDATLVLYEITDQGTNLVAIGNPTNDGGQIINGSAIRGGRYGIIVLGSGGSEGAYTVTVSNVPEIDDYADFAKLADAQSITLRDFLGQGSIAGSIEEPGDTDLFRFAFPDFFASMTITVSSLDSTLDPTVTLYEVSEDPLGNPILVRVGFNDNASGTTVNSRVIVPISPSREKDGPPARDYPFYYLVVEDANPSGGYGRYSVSLTFPPTDDQPDGDTDLDSTLDTGEFPLASGVVIDASTGLGSLTGDVEIDTDSDLVKFTAPAGGVATLTVDRQGASTLRLRISVMNSSGTILADSIGGDTTGSDPLSVDVNVVRGEQYFIVVWGFEDQGNPNVNTTLNGEWNLSIQTPPIDDHPNEGEFTLAATDQVFFNTTTGIAQMGGSEAGDPSNSRLSPTNDTDLVTFVSLLAGDQVIRLSPFAAAGGFVPRLRVFDAGLNLIADVSGSAALEELSTTVTAPAVGTRYYVLISAIDNNSDPLTGEYSLRITGPVPSGGGGGPDPSEIDFNTPTSITLNPRTGYGAAFDTISPAHDRDLFTFTTAAAGKVFVQITTPDGSILDASVRILNAANELVTSEVDFDADGIPGTTASVDFVSPAGTQYWVVVDGLGESTGSYQIRVQVQPFTNFLYFPEGYANDNIREFLSITNPNNVSATYSVYLRYESGSQLESFLGTTTIPANSRGGLTIVDGASYITPGVLRDTPYAIVLESDQPLGATLAHYDFGNAIGDSLTSTTSPTWYFPRVERNPGAVQDYILLYNPNNFEITVTLTAFKDGSEVSLVRTFGALRRGGFSINDITEFPIGSFGVRLSAVASSPSNNSAFIGIVGSMSHYTPGGDAGWATLGDPAGGSKVGVITNVAQSTKVNSDITFFNPNDVAITVTLTGTYVREDLPQFGRSIEIAAKGQAIVTAASLGLLADQPAGVRWSASEAVVATSAEYQQGDADSTTPTTVAGTQFRFGDAFINTSTAGSEQFETLYLYNPTGLSNTITINLVFFDGSTSSFTTTIRARGFAEVKLHERPEIITQRSGPQWFGVDLASNLPFAATMVHYDLAVNGGWATTGIPLGLLNPLSSIS